VLARRRAWFRAQPDLAPERLVFIDETGASTKMARLRGRAKRGMRAGRLFRMGTANHNIHRRIAPDRDVICPRLSGPSTMIVWITKGTLNAEQEAQAGRDYRQAA
jgi:hypothetical protein